MNLDLAGKNAMVCGSSRGIGNAVAHELVRMGANVTLVGRTETRLIDELVKLNMESGPLQQHDYLAVDFSNHERLRSAVQKHLKKTGKVYQILVNNSGGSPSGPVHTAEENDFAKTFEQHLLSSHTLMKLLLDGMKKSGYGRIVNIISTSVKQPLPNLGVSNTIRPAVANWSKTLANELGVWGITVNNVLPGATETERLQEIIAARSEKTKTTAEKIAEEMKSEIPMKRFGKPDEVANAVAFLCSPAAAYINGINLPVDGGRTACL